MDKNAIKKYAVWARRELIARVSQKAEQYGITEKEIIDERAESIHGVVLTPVQRSQRQALIHLIRREGYQQAMEEVAYTWFNRFIALRFMEVNDYLPGHTRAFTDEQNTFKPRILSDALNLELDGLDLDKVIELKETNKTEELYQYLLITLCNHLSNVLPGMFQKINDYTELLFPEHLLRESSVIYQLITEISEADFDVRSDAGQIEIIGWLYQYYISEKHEEVIDPLHGKIVKKDEVPAATQLFTTDWVVRYLIDNSVGKYWIERNPNSALAEKLDYFISTENGTIKYINETIVPQELTVLDPCVGSGHFLVYAFDVLMQIYTEYGYSERDAAAEIIKNNLHGLDIDGRAVQLAYFAVMMKARQYDKRFFSRGIQPHIYEIKESNNIDRASIEYFHHHDSVLKQDMDTILDVFTDAKEYGSLLTVPNINFEAINKRFAELNDEISIYKTYLTGEFSTFINAVDVMHKRYAVVATNPPYMNKYDAKLKDFLGKKFRKYSGDLFSAFIVRNLGFCVYGGYAAYMTPNVWMFIKSYEDLRSFIIENKSIASLIQMAKGAFYKDATVDVCAFICANRHDDEKGIYIRLESFKGDMELQKEKALIAIKDANTSYRFEMEALVFQNIQGSPLAYWISDKTRAVFHNDTLGSIASPCIGMRTGDNDRFLRLWFEVSMDRTGIGFTNAKAACKSLKKWFPYNKGGAFRRWYGNNERLVNWENDGAEIKAETRKKYPMLGDNLGWKISNEQFYFQNSITWSDTTSAAFSGRYSDVGALFDVKGSSCFPVSTDILYIIGLLNTKITQEVIGIINPTITTQVGDMARIPVIIEPRFKEKVEKISGLNIEMSRQDWDSFETSWDFPVHPIVRWGRNLRDATSIGATMSYYYGYHPEVHSTVELCYMLWQGECNERFKKLKANEEELNRIFIDIYGLQDELTPEVADKDVTVRKADLGRDIRSLVSYAVGCMLGRFSLDKDGLAFAGGEWDASQYHTYPADKDGVLPITDDEYFSDDIVSMFVGWVKTVFGEHDLEENLKYITSALYPSGGGTARELIRQYFLNDFYKDHLKIYQKRPIYWLFDAGKKNSFKCLIYLHRYQPDTVARVRTDYVHEMQARYRTSMEDLAHRVETASGSERVRLQKQLVKIQGQEEELRKYEEKIHHYADMMLPLDLDDGVKVNYAKLADVLAPIK
ncbi:MAG: BREX-1 system adenine-specific DNA-methyltransferase PglX [Clostridia bacterium]|nr:BREX-1 system adenine-specific DNA-methyltransferase PglX [Clostridia bacterium]